MATQSEGISSGRRCSRVCGHAEFNSSPDDDGLGSEPPSTNATASLSVLVGRFRSAVGELFEHIAGVGAYHEKSGMLFLAGNTLNGVKRVK
jgi:hypothetical protein